MKQHHLTHAKQLTLVLPFLFVCLLSLVISPAIGFSQERLGTGFDIGGVFESNLNSTIDPDAESLITATNTSTLRLFSLIEFGDWAVNIRLSAGADFPFYPGENIAPLKPTFGIDTLSIAGTVSLLNDPSFQSLDLQFGRISVSDPLGLYLSQTVDGFSLGLSGANTGFSLFGGYTGLIFKNSVQFSFTPGDQADDANQANLFAPPRMVAGLAGTFANESQSVRTSVAGILQGDLRSLVSSERLIPEGASAASGSQDTGLYSTFALVPSIQFTLSPQAFWDIHGVIQAGTTQVFVTEYETQTILSGSALTRFIWFPSRNDRLLFQVQWSSGDGTYRDSFDEGTTLTDSRSFLHLYKPLNGPSLGSIFSPKPGNLTWGTVQWSGRPFSSSAGAFGQNASLNASVFTFFRNQPGPVSDSRVSASVTNPYLGTELNLGLNVRPFSDLGFGLNGGIFLPASFSGGSMEGNAALIEAKLGGFFSLRF